MQVLIVAGRAVKTNRLFICRVNLVVLSRLCNLNPICVTVNATFSFINRLCRVLRALMSARLILMPVLVPSMN